MHKKKLKNHKIRHTAQFVKYDVFALKKTIFEKLIKYI